MKFCPALGRLGPCFSTGVICRHDRKNQTAKQGLQDVLTTSSAIATLTLLCTPRTKSQKLASRQSPVLQRLRSLQRLISAIRHDGD